MLNGFEKINFPYLSESNHATSLFVDGHVYNGILLSYKNEIMPFAATWVELEIIILSKVSQTKTNII